MFQSPKIGSVVSNSSELKELAAVLDSFNPLKSGQLFQISSDERLEDAKIMFQSPKIGSVVSNGTRLTMC